MCVFSSHSFWTSSSLDVPAKVTQEEGHTGGRPHRVSHSPSFCGACLSFYREKDSAVPFPRRPCKSNFVYPRINRSPLFGKLFCFICDIFSVRKNKKIPVRVSVPRFELKSQRQKVSRLPTEPPPGRPATCGIVKKPGQAS